MAYVQPGTTKAALRQSCSRTWEFLPGESEKPSSYAAVCAWPALPVRAESVLQLLSLGLVGDDIPVCLWLFPECGVSAAESKSSSNFDPLSNASASAGQPAGLDTQPLQSSASLDSSSVLPSPSTSFEPIKPDPTGSEYGPSFRVLLQKHAAWSEGKAAGPGGRS